jgi:PAS domain S-box-containing protein
MLPVAAGLMAGAKADEDIALFSAMTAQSPFAVLILNAAGELIYANQAYAVSSGYCPEDQRGQQVLWRSGDGFDNRLRGQLLALKEGECWEGEILSKRADGRHFWEQQTVSVLTHNGTVTHLVAIRRALSHAQRQLREVEQALCCASRHWCPAATGS